MAESPIETELLRHARRIGPILQELVPARQARLPRRALLVPPRDRRQTHPLGPLPADRRGARRRFGEGAPFRRGGRTAPQHAPRPRRHRGRRHGPAEQADGLEGVRPGERDQRRRLPVRALAARGDPFARAGGRAGAAGGPVPRDLRADHRGPGARHQFPLRRALHHRGLPAHGHAEDRPLPRARHGRRSDHRRRAGGDARMPAPARREPRPGVPDPRRHPRPDRRQGARRRDRLRHPRGQGEHPLRARAGALLAGRGRAPARGHAQTARGDDRRQRRRGPRPLRPVRLHRVRAGDGGPADPRGPARARRAAGRAAVRSSANWSLTSPKGKPE